MRRSALVLALCWLLAACVPQTALTQSGDAGMDSLVSRDALAGVWQNERGAHFCLDADGALGLPGQTARSGLSWSLRGDVLTLRTLEKPGGRPLEERLGVTRVSSSRLELRAPDGTALTWRRSRDTVGRLNGTVTYRERMALPPSVVVDVRLYLRGSDMPVASSLAVESGQGVLPFRVYYLVKDMGGAEEVLLHAAVFYETESLFAVPSLVPARLDQSPEIVVHRTLPGEGEPAPLPTPAQFRGSAGSADGAVTLTLYLEPGGLYLLRTEKNSPSREDSISAGRWRQIDRNHTVQLVHGADEPLSAALRPAGSLLLTTPAAPRGEMELRPTVQALPDQPFRVLGMFRMENGRATLTECSSGLDFAVETEGADFLALRSAYDKSVKKAAEPLLVACEGTVRRREGGLPGGASPDADLLLEIARFVEARPGITCAEPYASAPLMQTYWRLITLNGRPAQAFPDQAEPHLILRDGGQAAGSDGCNNFFMQWKSSGSSMSFGLGGSTLMMCPQGDEQARDFKEALAGVDAWSITGSVLELSREGRPVATFEAVAL